MMLHVIFACENANTILELKQNKKERQREYRCLLLGCGEAGKSTFIKQMRIINGDEFTEEEESEYKMAIAKNILSAIKTLLENMSFEEEHAIQSDNTLDNAMQNVFYLGYVVCITCMIVLTCLNLIFLSYT